MKFKIYTDQDRDEFIARIKVVNLNRLYIAEFKQFRKKRTLASNRLYWLWITAISVETGNERDALHGYYKARYLPKIEIFGEMVPVSTSKLDTKQFSVYLDSIFLHAGENGIVLVRPEDRQFEEFCSYYEDRVA